MRASASAARSCGDAGTGLAVIFVGEADGGSSLGLDPNLVAQRGQLGHRLRGEADAVFVVLDFLGYADAHGCLLMHG